MKQLVSNVLALLCLVQVSMAQDMMVINDPNAELRKTEGFHGIRGSSGIDIIIKQGTEQAVVVSAAELKVRDRIRTEVKEGILRIWYDYEGLKVNWKENKRLKAYISVTNLDLLHMSGACDVKIDGLLKGDRLVLELSGASSLKGQLVYNTVRVEQSGAADCNLSGKVTDLIVSASGASDFKGFELVADNCQAEASGASDIKITVNKDLKVQASGASDVDYRGTAVISSFSSSGASSVRKRSR